MESMISSGFVALRTILYVFSEPSLTSNEASTSASALEAKDVIELMPGIVAVSTSG